ncbi:hypothetical protein R1flu_004241 [Riccia fluitans]|uniref:Uncharacterized protein n=1 Tax=Riccia fluitans TaxID=41844 RepID=A0ABD1YPR2_9MARC
MSVEEVSGSFSVVRMSSSSTEVENFRRLFPIQYIERYLDSGLYCATGWSPSGAGRDQPMSFKVVCVKLMMMNGLHI